MGYSQVRVEESMMTNRIITCIYLLFLLSLVIGCRSIEHPTQVPIAGESIQFANTQSLPIEKPATVLPSATSKPSPTVTPEMPTVTASTTVRATAILPPLLAMEKSPQQFGYTETYQVALGDLDDDGDQDAVFANMAANHSAVWINDGSGQFSDTGQQLTQQGHGLDIGDLDSDSDLDVFITCAHFNGNGKPSVVYFNNGLGVFQESGQDLGDAELSGVGVNLLDVDNDGDLDAHVVYYERIVDEPDRVFLNDGHGFFVESGITLEPEVIAWGDLDLDGDLDIFGKVYGQGYQTLLNDGSGHLTTGWELKAEQAMDGSVSLNDFDGDGDLDALVANGFRSKDSFPTLLFLNNGTGDFLDSGQRLNPTKGADFVAGDLDDDGDLDVFVANMDQPNEVWLNDGNGHFVDSGLRLEGSTSRSLSTVPTMDDLDGDGDLDIFLGSFRDRPAIWLNAGLVDSNTSSSSQPSGGDFVFVSTRDGDGEIYRMNIDGSNLRQLTDNQVWDGYPSWSPDGSQIAYYSYLSREHWVIMVMDADGGNQRQLTDSPGCNGAPHWSPDGSRIAYGSDLDCTAERREIFVIDADGSNPRNLTQNEVDDMSSAWSPDGQQIAFSSNRDGDYEIYIMNVDSSVVRQLTDNNAEDIMPSWSPDGVHIAFVSDRHGNDEIYVVDIDGGSIFRLTDNPLDDWFPIWSPDEKHLLFNSWRDGNLEIYVMDADGGNVLRLTNHPKEDFNAVWQPWNQ